MTTQINDTCFHRKVNFEIVGSPRAGLLDPGSLGHPLTMLSTGCWRGYVAHYAVHENSLILIALRANFSTDHVDGADPDESPDVFGVKPNLDAGLGAFYGGFQRPVPFTGQLTLAAGFIQKHYSQWDLRPAWKYKHVRDVTFETGKMIADENRSKRARFFRVHGKGGKPWVDSDSQIGDLKDFLSNLTDY